MFVLVGTKLGFWASLAGCATQMALIPTQARDAQLDFVWRTEMRICAQAAVAAAAAAAVCAEHRSSSRPQSTSG